MTLGTRLDFPDDLKLFAETVVFDRGQRQKMLGAIARRVQCRALAGCSASRR